MAEPRGPLPGGRQPGPSLTPSRREVLKGGVIGGAALAAGVLSPATLRALAAPPVPGKLADIEHVVILIQENRSFDHYFGTYPAVRGFSDPAAIPGVFQQAFAKNTSVAPVGKVLPYHLDTSSTGAGECTPDPTHGYDPQHQSWNQGAMDAWGTAHAGDADWSFMGYYTRADLPYYYAIADAFTICDSYHCSVMGSTTSNRLYSMTGMLDPDGLYGGPIKSTITYNPANRGTLGPGWITYPELLTDAGIQWRSYSDADSDNQDNALVNFKQYYPGNPGVDNMRAAKLSAALFGHTFQDFLSDAAAGQLPPVSWVYTRIPQSEHPALAPQDGEVALQSVVTALTSNPLTWPRTALFYTYDENGGFFDHVPPPTAPPGTPGEYIKNESAPIGLGFRVPMLVISPFSRGGFVCRDTFDHTSLLRFLEERFGVSVPNLSAWRRTHTGNLTSAFNFIAPDSSTPSLPTVIPTTQADHPECATEEATMKPSPTPTQQSTAGQEAGTRPAPSGPVPGSDVPEFPAGAAALAAGGAAALAGWWLRRRSSAEAEPKP